MPQRDGTGPNGEGPMTGRQMGNCKNAEPQERPRLGLRRGFGRGQGRGAGRGFRNRRD